MTPEVLCLLCLGLCLGYEDEKKNEKLPKPFLHAWPSSVVEAQSNVTLKCQAPFQNVTLVLYKVNDSGYKQEQISTENEAEFLFTDLKLKDAGSYFCAYKTTASHEWSESSEHLQLVITDTRTIFVAIFSCISILLLFLSVFIIYRCSQHGSSPEESTKRISHSKRSEQEAAEADLSRMERVSVSMAGPQGVTYAELNINALSEAASDTTHEPPGSHEYAAVKV
ncbi:V-set and transmembrane domain-containing protein 1 isoform X4 [Trachypithecus francoisi]|uniref:V-set and transmembrane domain-containing protein 1 isoform X4 n=1 Tax=Trachypithecus francoisi TaxID=54180 RepID=UPI00141B8D90|nr:V-set and transmembrane domain-containing protein 1 isoform X4 [Trachypithecus francoisi]